jgi:glycosyltransferase involved in cell wall biosynthesis
MTVERAAARLGRLSRAWQRQPAPVATVAVNRRPIKSPWGGGNQWLDQVIRSLRFHGYSIRFDLRRPVDCILMVDPRSGPTVSFDVAEISNYKAAHAGVVCIQRVNDNDKHRASDFRDRVQEDASRVADHVVFLSAWLRDYEAERWFDVRRPHSVILNGADPRFFHPIGGAIFRPGETIRLVTHHWSDNPSKGFPVYAEIDRLIADGRLPGVELWVVGRWPADVKWRAARTVPPLGPADLGQVLRQCHVYVTASQWESGGMHFIEGAQCGLPVLYHEDGGGIVEVARRFGVGFRSDIESAIGAIQAKYVGLREALLADPPSGDRMCVEYRQLIERAIEHQRRN